jgi:hypothetical protein
MKNSNVIEQIEKLVAAVTDDIKHASLDERLDALKILQPFYTVLKKAQGPYYADDVDTETTMDELQRRLEAVNYSDTGFSHEQ